MWAVDPRALGGGVRRRPRNSQRQVRNNFSREFDILAIAEAWVERHERHETMNQRHFWGRTHKSDVEALLL